MSVTIGPLEYLAGISTQDHIAYRSGELKFSGWTFKISKPNEIVDRILLVAGDSDFIPAMKLARIEGVLITVVPLKNNITRDMREHADEVRDFDVTAITW